MTSFDKAWLGVCIYTYIDRFGSTVGKCVPLGWKSQRHMETGLAKLNAGAQTLNP